MAIVDQLRVTIEFAPRLAHLADPESDEYEHLVHNLTDFVDQLISDLALPLTPSVQIGIGSDKTAVNVFSATINDQPCRLPLPLSNSEQITRLEASRLLAATIYENRELCLTSPMSEKILNDWLSHSQTSESTRLAPAVFHQLLLDLMRLNCRIDRCKSTLTTQSWEVLNPEYTAAVVAQPSTIKLYLNRQQASLPSFNTNDDRLPSSDGEYIPELITLMQDGLFYELGILLPNPTIEVDERLQDGEFQLQINDVRLPAFSGLEADQTLVNETVEGLAPLQVSGERAFNPANGIECSIVRGTEAANTCRLANLTTWGPAGFVVLLQLSKEIRRHAGVLLTPELVEFMMSQFGQVFPAVTAAVQANFELPLLTAILRDLLDEEISVRNLRAILEGLLSINGTTDADLSRLIVFYPYTLNLLQLPGGNEKLAAAVYSNYVRTFLKRYISHKYARGISSLPVYLVDPEIEARLNQSEARPLTRDERERLIAAVLNEAQYSPTATPVILTSIETRWLLRKLLEREFPWLAILSYQELSPEMNIQPLARISWQLQSRVPAS